MQNFKVLAAGVAIPAIIASIALVPYWLGAASTPALASPGPVVGELTYWTEGEAVEARVVKFAKEGAKMLEAKQTDLPLKGILITRVVFPECGSLKFQQNDLGTIYGTAEAEEAEKYPECPIKDWSGSWRIGRII